jgi:hypothetical protein
LLLFLFLSFYCVVDGRTWVWVAFTSWRSQISSVHEILRCAALLLL